MAESCRLVTTIETWRPVAGHPDYEVSSEGRVRSWKRPGKARDRATSPHLLRLVDGGGIGYLQVRLSDGPIARQVRVHVLVAEVFIGPRPAGMQVAHGDGDPTNNTVDNLRYAIPVDNNRDKIAHGRSLRGSRHAMARLTESAVVELRRRAAAGEPVSALASAFKISRRHAYQIIRGERWSHLQAA